jgi:hypothetical protein
MALPGMQAAANPGSKRTQFLAVAHESGRSDTTISVDLSDSPNFLRFTVTGDWPTPEQQRQLRDSLSASGELTARTRALIDLRELTPGGPADPVASAKEGLISRVQAYLVATSEQHHFARQCRIAAGAGRVVEIFIEERAALEWLWNAEPDF